MSLSSAVGTRVKAYRNLNKPSYFSIKQTAVIGYTTGLMLSGVTFTGAHTKAQQLIQSGQARSVHAYAVGTLIAVDITPRGVD